jgi:atypical dual specificity phosphatase
MFGKMTFYPTLAYNVFLERLKFRDWYNRVDETVVLGALPFRETMAKLIDEEKVKGVVSMNEDFELKYWVLNQEEYRQKDIQFLQLNTADIFHAPTQDKLRRGVEFIQQFEGTGNSVYVHCKAGRTRSATLVGCYLMQKHNWDPKKAVQYMISKRHHVLLHSVQFNALKVFYEENVLRPQSQSQSQS